MDSNIRKPVVLICFCVFLFCQTVFCEVKLPQLISDHMVLQRDKAVKIWGWADANEKVTVEFQEHTYTTAAGSDGEWAVVLCESKAGGPYTMQINGENRITIEDIMFGDVWLCSGQSNMELPMARVRYRYPEVIAESENPAIRQFYVPRNYNFKEPQEDLESGSWESADPKSVLRFTAVGYFFAKELYDRYQVPIGLINSSLGGSPAQAWMSEDALKEFPHYLETAEKFKDDEYIKQIVNKDKTVSDNWYKLLNEKDRGLNKGQKPWYDTGYDASGWETMNVPGYWADEELGPVNGVVWFRKKIDLPASTANKPAKLWLGRIVDADETYVNGKLVGSVSYQYPPRIYDVPANLLRAGENIIAVRVINNSGRGGFVPDKPYRLTVAGESIDLTGPWRYKLGAVMEPLPGKTFIQWQPTGLYNGMIAPLLNYEIKGVIWYQGESNTANPEEYEKLFPALIANWRDKWGRPDLPFLYVQLANFMEAGEQPSESNWARLRQSQLETLDVANTAMAVTVDIGEWNDIHPLNKEDVGKRLALGARKIAYGEDIVHSGPIYESMEIEGNRIILTFTSIGGGLVAKGDGRLKHFAIAGPDRKFVWANAEIEDDKVIVWSEEIPNPTVVRYAWADNPRGANLYNKQGLPASPFTTDN